MVQDFQTRFWISLILTIPVLILSPMIQDFLGVSQFLSFEGDKYVLFFSSSLIYFYGGWPFLKGLGEEISKKQPGMMTLIGVAIATAYIYSSSIVFVAGTDVAIEAADIILVKSNPMDVVSILGLARATYRKMVENLLWATGYNLFAIPAAADAFYISGLVLTPTLGAVLMSLSMVICAVNSRFLRVER